MKLDTPRHFVTPLLIEGTFAVETFRCINPLYEEGCHEVTGCVNSFRPVSLLSAAISATG